MDPKNSVIKRLWCSEFAKTVDIPLLKLDIDTYCVLTDTFSIWMGTSGPGCSKRC